MPPYRVRLNFPGLSYGLALLRLFRIRAVRQKGLGILWSKRRLAGVWRQSTGLPHLIVRVSPGTIKKQVVPFGDDLLFGTPEGTRTPNPRNRNPMLYPLSHWRIHLKCLAIIADKAGFVKSQMAKKFSPGAGASGENGSYSSTRAMCTSSSCFWSTVLGAPIIRSWAFLFMGKVMTSRMLSSPVSIIIRRSTPGAAPA